MLVTLQDQRVKTTHTTILSFSKSSVHTDPQILSFATLIVVLFVCRIHYAFYTRYIMLSRYPCASTQISCDTQLKFALKSALHPSPWSSHKFSSQCRVCSITAQNNVSINF